MEGMGRVTEPDLGFLEGFGVRRQRKKNEGFGLEQLRAAIS